MSDKIIKNAKKYSGNNWSLKEIQEIISNYVKSQNYSIVMGSTSDHQPQWWIVTNREASILVKHGYEIAF